MARRIYHYYNGQNPMTDNVMCGSTLAWRARHVREAHQVTCQKCRAGLMKRGLLPRPPRVVQNPAPGQTTRPQEEMARAVRETVQARTVPRTQAPPDPENVDDYNNSLLRLGII